MLEINGLQAGYGKKIIIPDLTVQGLERGKVTSLLGPNGSGKTTLLKTIAGLTTIKKGHIVFDNQDMTHLSFGERAKKTVYLPQSLPASVHLRVFESVLVAANATQTRLEQANREQIEHVETLLERIGIGHLALSFLDELSGGQKQLVGIAQALIRKPQMMLLDEPLSALDLNYQFHVMELVREETERHNMLTLVVLHDLNIALRHTSYALMISQGCLRAQGTPEAITTPEIMAQVYGVRSRTERSDAGEIMIAIDGLCS